MKYLLILFLITQVLVAQENNTVRINYQLKKRMTKSTFRVMDKLKKKFKLKAASYKNRLVESMQVEKNNINQVIKELKDSGAVAFAEPDYIQYPVETIPQDPQLNQQWQNDSLQMDRAWELATGKGVIVAVCDSGVDAEHEDLKDNVILPGFNTANGSTDSSPQTTHGTRVAGYVAAVGNNNRGVAGIAHEAKILPIRVTHSSRGAAYTSNLAECVRVATDRGAKVINVSFTGVGSSTMNAAGEYARERGSLLFMSAGNRGNNISNQPDWTSFVIVGATDINERKASFSNYGTPIDIVGPGVNVFTTTTNNRYSSASGTSFSSPIVAGVAALLWSLNPDFTPDQIEEFLYKGARQIGSENLFGSGTVDAYESLLLATQAIGGNLQPQAIAKVSEKKVSIPAIVKLNGSESFDRDGEIVKAFWTLSDGSTFDGLNIEIEVSEAGILDATLTVVDNEGKESQSTVQIEAVDTSKVQLFVEDIKMNVRYSRRSATAGAKVLVLDSLGEKVVNANVFATWNNEKALKITTNDQGVAQFESPRLSRSTRFNFKIVSVEKGNLIYNEDLNKEESDSIRARQPWYRRFF